jgi:hypothetical protein
MEVVGEILNQVYSCVEGHQECLVFSRAQGFIQKIESGFLFEFKSVPDAGARIDQESDGQGKVGFTGKIRDRLWLVIFEKLKIRLLQIGDQSPPSV